MANPQTENGYTKIANEIMIALCRVRIPGEARQILDVIISKTYGWNKKCDRISLSQFVEMTGQQKSHVSRNIKKLEAMNLIVITLKGNKLGHTYNFIKDFERWKPLPKKVTLPNRVIRGTPIGVLQKHIKEKNVRFSEMDMKGAVFLYEKIREHSGHVTKSKKEIESWANIFRLMVERDSRTPEQISAAIKYATKDDFWQSNILSANKLKKHMDTLLTQMHSRG